MMMRAQKAIKYMMKEFKAMESDDHEYVQRCYMDFMDEFNQLFPEFDGVTPEIVLGDGKIIQVHLTVNGNLSCVQKAKALYLAAPKNSDIEFFLFRDPIDFDFKGFGDNTFYPGFKWDSTLISFLPSMNVNTLEFYIYFKNRKTRDMVEAQISQILDNCIGEFNAMSTISNIHVKIERRKPTPSVRPLNEIKECYKEACSKIGIKLMNLD